MAVVIPFMQFDPIFIDYFWLTKNALNSLGCYIDLGAMRLYGIHEVMTAKGRIF